MRGVNKVVLIGNVGRDPDIQYVEGDIPFAKFPLATTEMRKERSGQFVSETEWHSIVLWRGLADLASKYLRKGSSVYIEGRLHTRVWEDKDHNKRSHTEIIGDNVIMLDKKKSADSNSQFTAQDNEDNKSDSATFPSRPEVNDGISDVLPF